MPKIELTTQPLYDVEVVFTDGTVLRGTFLDVPTLAALIIVAGSLGLTDDFAKILAVADEIKPENYTAEIKIADVRLATVTVKVGEAYAVKRTARKPRSDKGATRKAKPPTADNAVCQME